MAFGVKWNKPSAAAGPSSGGGSSSKDAGSSGHPDFTRNHLKDATTYKLGHLRSLGLSGEVTALAVDPVYSLLGIGTSTGLVHLVGCPSFQCTLNISTLSQSRNPSNPPQVIGVKFLTFVPGGGKLCAIDDKNTLHVWNVGPGGVDDAKNLPNKEITVSLYGDVTYVDVPSPAHSHIFFTLRDGVTLAYDLQRHNVSPYKIENLWKQHEDRLRRSGIAGRKFQKGTPPAVCCAMSPRDFNTMLVGYEGGVIQWDMKERTAVKVFELLLPPGAPGGSSYVDQEIWSERTPGVTSIAWRPDGLVFAVGHEDGCISIWALEDSDKPLMVRTLTKEDVNVTDAESLFDSGALDSLSNNGKAPEQPEREPIFKLTWASFPDTTALRTLIAAQGTDAAGEPLQNATVQYAEKGETMLVVLGGCLSNEPPAIHCLQISPFAPPALVKAAVTATISEGMSLAKRTAFRESLTVTGFSQYPTQTPAEDFVLVPRSSPYFNLSYDPISIVIFLTPDPNLPPITAPHGQRSVDAWSFPPPRSDEPPSDSGRKNFHTTTEEALQGLRMSAVPTSPGSGSLSPPPQSASWRMPWSSAPASPSIADLAARGQLAVKRAKPPRPFRLPSIFWTGGTTVLGTEIYSLSTDIFRRLIAQSIDSPAVDGKPRIPLRGGSAVPDLFSPNAPDVTQTKIEKYRILATYHSDGAVRFWDVSPHILVLPSPLRFEYPSPLPHLTISVTNMLKHPSLRHLPLSKLYRSNPGRVKITGIDMTLTTLECFIHMESGEVLVYKFGTANERPAGDQDKRNSRDTEEGYFAGAQEADPQGADEHVDSLTSTSHLANWNSDGYKPITILTTRRGPIIATAVSDIGFLAVSYYANSVAIVDLRGPDVILREGFSEEGMRVKKKKKNSQNLPAEPTNCLALRWAICKLSGESHKVPKLIAQYAKGLTKIYTLTSVLGEWVVENKAITVTHDSLSNPIKSFMISYATGDMMIPNADELRQSMSAGTQGGTPSKAEAKIPVGVWIAVAKKAVRSQIDFNGERLAKVDMADGEEVTSAHVVNKNGNKVLMLVTNHSSAVMYTIPTLQWITRVDLSFGMMRPLGTLSVDIQSGDYIEYIGPMEIYLRTIFNHRKPLPPRIDPSTKRFEVPAPPVPLDSAWGVSSWIWGGAPMTGVQLDALVAGPNRPPIPKPPVTRKPPKPLITWGEPPEQPIAKPARATPARQPTNTAPDPRARKDVYSDMTNAARERGEILDSLEDRFMSTAQAAGDWLNETKNAAAKQTAKASARTFLGI